MQGKNVELTVFYCQHQGEKIAPLLNELAGSDGIELKKIALPCSGKIEVFHLTKAIEKGADGVAIFGCPEGNCRYVIGSQRAGGRVRYTQRILKAIGIEENRVSRFILEKNRSQEGTGEFAAWARSVQGKIFSPPQSSNS
jgi:coenzyme F420-reducing hydrogenase delta subunit